MLRSKLIEILQEQIKQFGNEDVYAIKSFGEGYVCGREIKKVGLDADNHTVIDITDEKE